MNRRLRIAVADDEHVIQEVLVQMLARLGHETVFTAATGRDLVAKCRDYKPDLVITDIVMPDMDGLDAAAAIYEQVATPVILVTAHSDEQFIQRAEENHILAFLVKPVNQVALEAAIALAVRRFEEFTALQREAADLRKALADRKLIERAKGLLMQHLRVAEDEAFRRLQKLASSKNRKLVDVAEMIITAAEALNG